MELLNFPRRKVYWKITMNQRSIAEHKLEDSGLQVQEDQMGREQAY
jgi:hypothetical protein